MHENLYIQNPLHEQIAPALNDWQLYNVVPTSQVHNTTVADHENP